MKSKFQSCTLARCALVLALITGLAVWVMQPVSAIAGEGTAKGGASQMITLKPVKTVADLQNVEAGDTVVMSCPKCKESYAQVVEKSFKGSTGDQLKTVPIHLCDGCSTKIVTKGHGKSKQDMVVHTCKTCGSKDVSCCVMKKGGGTTAGMEEKK